MWKQRWETKVFEFHGHSTWTRSPNALESLVLVDSNIGIEHHPCWVWLFYDFRSFLIIFCPNEWQWHPLQIVASSQRTPTNTLNNNVCATGVDVGDVGDVGDVDSATSLVKSPLRSTSTTQKKTYSDKRLGHREATQFLTQKSIGMQVRECHQEKDTLGGGSTRPMQFVSIH